MNTGSLYRRIPKPAKTERQRVFVRNLRWAQQALGLTLRTLSKRAQIDEVWLRRAATQGIAWTKGPGSEAIGRLERFLGCPAGTFWEQAGFRFQAGVARKHHLKADDPVADFQAVLNHFESDPPPSLLSAIEIIRELRLSISGSDPSHSASVARASAGPGTRPGDQAHKLATASQGEPAVCRSGRASPKADHQHVLIKWTGGKWRQARQIVAQFPRRIRTYHEPFLGGGSVLYELLGSEIEVQRYEVSDHCEPLIGLWKIIQDDPAPLVDEYAKNRALLQTHGADHFQAVRERFNRDRRPADLFFLTRTCRLGHVRFNQAGEFNAGYHKANPGMAPKKVARLTEEWRRRLAGRDITFSARDYQEVMAEDGDMIYVDAPYKTGEGRYYAGPFDHDELFGWLRRQPCSYMMSLNGFVGKEDRRLDVPDDLYDRHLLLGNGESKYDRLARREARPVVESLYVRRRE